MTDTTIEAFFAKRQKQLTMQVHLYALVDGLLYADAADASSLQRSQSAVALFDGTPDASLADAGPWLIDYERAAGAIRQTLSIMASGSTGVSWLISAIQSNPSPTSCATGSTCACRMVAPPSFGFTMPASWPTWRR